MRPFPSLTLPTPLPGGQAMGQEEKQAQDELREAEPWPALLL